MTDLIADLQSLEPSAVRLVRCQVDVHFPASLKPAGRLVCPWYEEFGGRPQIVEVAATGWETYHFESLASAREFAERTRRNLPGEVLVQLRGSIEISQG